MKKVILFFLLVALLFACCKSCNNSRKKSETTQYMHTPKRAMYHWKNTYDLSYEELNFMKEHRIERLYVRFFDVTLENIIDGFGPRPIPTASVVIKQPWNIDFPEIVPTIFITPEAMSDICKKGQARNIAKKMLERIDHMRSFYDIPKNKVREIQIDCDWTPSIEQGFFSFCKEVRRQMPDTALLSCTIRLHQLRKQMPPVDYGVLMLYNTNNLRDFSVKNSILSADDMKPYLKHVQCDLPLDLAYPTFAWDLWFHKGQFQGILRSTCQADSLRRRGETIKHEESSFNEIMAVKKLVEKRLPKPKHGRSTILYHLDKNNIKRYNYDEIEIIFGD